MIFNGYLELFVVNLIVQIGTLFQNVGIDCFYSS
jgi:hypothetical protein